MRKISKLLDSLMKIAGPLCKSNGGKKLWEITKGSY